MRTAISALCGIVLVLCLVALGPAITLWQTVLNPDFVTSRLDVIDAPMLVAEQVKHEMPSDTEWLYPVIDKAAADLEAWSLEQISTIARTAIGYIKGEQEFHAVISLVELKTYLNTHLGDLLLELPSDVLPPFPPGQMDMLVQVVGNQLLAMAPDTLQIDESFLDEQMLAQLHNARDLTASLRTVLTVAPIVALLMLLGIALVQRFRPRPTFRYVGIPLAIAGITCLVLALLLPSLVWGAIAGQLPPEVVPVVPGIVNDCCTPLFIYSGVLLLVGLGLVGLSFILRTPHY